MPEEAKVRKIIHIDMDAFYASVEQLDNPKLKGKPIAVGGAGSRGVIAAASYEARKFGVRSAMSSRVAKELCPELIFVKHNFSRYKEVSAKIRSIFHQYTDLVEPLALDEAFLDVSNHQNPSASLIAEEIRDKVFAATGLTASAGISVNKFLAKVASDINKPNGQATISPEEVIPFLEKLEIDRFFGVGKVTARKMKKMGIFTGADLKGRPEEELEKHFGKSGKLFYKIVRGEHDSPVRPNRTRKSVGAERTFGRNLKSEVEMIEHLNGIADELERRLRTNGLKGRTITLKIKYRDFEQQTRSRTLEHFFDSKRFFFPLVEELVYQEKLKESVRLLGLSVTNLDNQEEESQKVEVQLELPFID